MSLAIDSNHNVLPIREDMAVGGSLTPTVGSTWQRLMPSGGSGASDAAAIEDDKRQLSIGNLRADTPNIRNWSLLILNEGYAQQNIILEYADKIATLKNELNFHPGLLLLGSNIEFVIFPTIDIPLGITYQPNADTTELDIGYATADTITPTVNKIGAVKADRTFVVFTRQLHRIFYRNAAANDEISWGEHYIV